MTTALSLQPDSFYISKLSDMELFVSIKDQLFYIECLRDPRRYNDQEMKFAKKYLIELEDEYKRREI